MKLRFNQGDALVQEFEGWIRAGQAQRVAAQLTEMNLSAVPNKLRLPLANICRRIGLPAQGLKLLSPLVQRNHGKNIAGASASEEERAEYAVLLLRKGIVNEAVEILDEINPQTVPAALLYRSFCHFRKWEYAEAIPRLEKYLSSDLNDYSRLVGQVNLVAAHIGDGQLEKAAPELNDLTRSLEDGQAGRLKGNCLELTAQLALLQGHYKESLAHLEKAEQALTEMPTLDHFFVFKWRAIAKGLDSRDPSPLIELKEAASRIGNWETVREADRFLLRVAPTTENMEHLIFGTPHPAYRRRIQQETILRTTSQSYLWGMADGPVLNMVNLGLSSVPDFANWGKCAELLEVLMRDFYVPCPMGSAFAELWPDEHFDIFSSPARLHQITYRTRQLLHESRLPFAIEEKNGMYRILRTGGGGIIVPQIRRSLSGYRMELEKLMSALPPHTIFTARQARSLLQMSRVTFQRFSAWAISQNLMTRQGMGSTTAYRLAAPAAAVAA